MAWCYQICLECGDDRDAAQACLSALNTLLPSHHNAWAVIEEVEGRHWAKLNVDHLSISVDDWEAVVLRFWQPMFFALPFRFALIGLEVEDARSYVELVEDGLEDGLARMLVDEVLWRAMGCPGDLVELGDGKYGRLLADHCLE